MVVAAEFPPLSLFVMVMFQERLFPSLCALNPDSPAANAEHSVCSDFSLCCSYPSCWAPEAM